MSRHRSRPHCPHRSCCSVAAVGMLGVGSDDIGAAVGIAAGEHAVGALVGPVANGHRWLGIC